MSYVSVRHLQKSYAGTTVFSDIGQHSCLSAP